MGLKQPKKKQTSQGLEQIRLKSPVDQKMNLNMPKVLVKDLKDSDKSEEITNDGSVHEGFITQKLSPKRRKNVFQTLNRRKKRARYMNLSIVNSPKKSKFMKEKNSPTYPVINPSNKKVSSPRI